MYLAVALAMVGAATFGLDQGNFGNVQAFESFRAEWCVGRRLESLMLSRYKFFLYANPQMKEQQGNSLQPVTWTCWMTALPRFHNYIHSSTGKKHTHIKHFFQRTCGKDTTTSPSRYGDAESCSELGSLQNDRWQDFVTWGASLITFGAAAGAVLLGPFVTHQLGRKPCIQMGGAVCFMGCLMASYLSFHNVAEFFLGRFITGLGVGLSCFALPLYNAEISTPQIRGATGSIFQLNVVIGCFVSCLVTLLDDDWYFGMVLPGLAGALLVLGGFFLPESPRFLMEKMVHQHPEEAFKCGLRSLKRIRSGDVKPEADQIFEQIRAEMETKHMGFRDLFRDPNLRKRVLIACTLVIGQQATGVNAFLGYAATLFKECGIENPILFDSIFNSIMILGCIAGLLLVDSPYAGRRSQLLVATALMGPPLTIAGFALRFGWPRIITMASVIIYGVGFQFAWGTIPWIYPAEIFSMSEKESAVSCAVGVNYVANAAVVYLTPGLMKWSTPGTLQIFGLLNILNALFVFLYIKETKGGYHMSNQRDIFRPKVLISISIFD